ncbi:MAG: BNR-4 repeat-containing protein, partial [Caldilineaceae bacterium]|nr:BNR-4 repeat-containing protein [Caldilineaceae bacterium]
MMAVTIETIICMTNPMPAPATQPIFCTKATGYRGIWHGQTPTHDEYVYKYSGGLGTYPHQSRPFALYRPEVNKTFFCWGGTVENFVPTNQQYGANQLLHMVSYFDHTTGQVPRPTILFDKYCGDAHDNPVITIDDAGYIWIFSPSHGQWTTPSFVHRSREPYSIDRFETVTVWLYAYPQIWHVPSGFTLMHTQYDNGRKLRCTTSADGITWTTPVRLAEIEQGHYQVTAQRDDKLVTAFNYHPAVGGLEARTNLYFMQSTDNGVTWTTAAGEILDLPLTTIENDALIRNYRAEGLLVY